MTITTTDSWHDSVTGDAKVELDETYTVDLSSIVAGGVPGGTVTFGDNQGQGTVLNDDAASLSINDVSQNENAGNAVFTVTLDAAVDGGVNVDYTTTDGTATVADSDYATNAGTLNFAGTAGETQTVTVAVTGDAR